MKRHSDPAVDNAQLFSVECGDDTEVNLYQTSKYFLLAIEMPRSLALAALTRAQLAELHSLIGDELSMVN